MSGISERAVRRIGRPSTAEPYRELVREILEQDPRLMSLELLRRAKLAGYTGGQSAFYTLLAAVRPTQAWVELRFESLPGEFSQHDFGEVAVSVRHPAPGPLLGLAPEVVAMGRGDLRLRPDRGDPDSQATRSRGFSLLSPPNPLEPGSFSCAPRSAMNNRTP